MGEVRELRQGAERRRKGREEFTILQLAERASSRSLLWRKRSHPHATLAMSVVGGKLSFKGDKKKKKKRERENPSDDDEPLDVPEHSLDPVAGTGKLTSSGVVVTGVDTDFTAELSVGDTLLVTVVDRFRNTQSDESRVVNMVLGRTSLNVQGPFTCDLTSPTAFMFVRKAPDVEALRAARDARKRQERRLAEESSSVTYKVVVPGSGTWKKWKTVTETGGERTARRCSTCARRTRPTGMPGSRKQKFCKHRAGAPRWRRSHSHRFEVSSSSAS